jgi:uncharacterized protein YjiS (DUF1127 family)
MTARLLALPARPAVQKRERPASYWRRAVPLLRIWRRRFREREALAMMNDRLLRDIGLTRCDALREANKPFWRE